MGVTWEARLKVKISVDDEGKWTDEHKDLLKPFARLRVEIMVGKPPLIPLIDGPIVSHDIAMSSEPGDSYLNIIVQDDSVYLNQDDIITIHENLSPQQIAQLCFDSTGGRIASTCIEQGITQTAEVTMQRSTSMQLLQELGKRQNMHVFILPGSEPGMSIGCFHSLPKGTEKKILPCTAPVPNEGDFAPLILLGPSRNLKIFSASNNSQSPAQVKAASLDPTTKTAVEKISDPDQEDLSYIAKGAGRNQDLPTRLLPAYHIGALQESEAVSAMTEKLSYGIDVSGSVFTDIYPNVIQPYRVVQVVGVSPEYCGLYLISEVTHQINKSGYSQSFKLKGVAS